MATGSGGSRFRIVILVLILAAVGAFALYRLRAGSGAEAMVVNGAFSGKTIADVTRALGVEPVEQPNPEAEAGKSTARIYLYTLPNGRPGRQWVRARVAAGGTVIYTRFVDEGGNEVNIDPQR